MSKKQLLSCLKKRDYLNAQVFGRDECVNYGKLFQEAGYLSDAIDFFAKAEEWNELKSLLPRVIEEGDVFLFEKIYKSLKETPEPRLWEEIGQNALKQGKLLFAYKAFLKANLSSKVAEIEKALKEKGLFVLPQTFLPGTGQQPENKKRLKKRKK